ncbi:nucleoid-associated protein [Parabacteroides sp. Marseille-P3160]|uniref:nucleoid-associated protein n=1 Tax=Parabacteroides sp. Marseille-P3160 TaxID=1917887 RepID=UPI0009BC0AE5|nr:nucleoid-associated protein [Parabacteroides sp. Marseille-P3160]
MAKQFREIGANINLKNIIIHQALKEQNIRHTAIKAAESPIKVGQKERLFVGRINKTYYKKSNPIWGIFGNEDTTFQALLKKYCTDSDFYTFSVESLKHYKKALEKTIAATGGFMIFAHFENTDIKNDYLLVLMINNKDGYVVNDDDLTIRDIKNLDLSKVDIACMINLSKWNDIESGVDTESKTYLSFVKGNKDVSYYFMSFIDCNNKTTSAESTQRLLKAVDAYSDTKSLDRETRIQRRNEIYKYCDGCISDKKEIHLSVISALLDPDNPLEFQEFASDETFGVSSVISGDKTKLKPMKYVIYKAKDKKIAIEFDCSILGKDVVYNKQKNELTIRHLPQEFVSQIPQ